METYKPDQISVTSIKDLGAGKVEIHYSAMLETLYFCPGARVTEAEDSISVEFVRCGIKETCPVTHGARKDAAGTWYFVVESGKKPIFMAFSGGRKRIHPA